MLQEGKLGRITACYICYNIQHPEAHPHPHLHPRLHPHPKAVCARLPGIIKQIGTHHAYTALYLLGESPSSVSAMRTTIRDDDQGTAPQAYLPYLYRTPPWHPPPGPQENLAMISMQMASGALCHLEMNFAADDHSSDAWSFYVKLIGTKGRLQ